MKLIIPPGAFEAKVDADPPRIASTCARFRSTRSAVSALAPTISPNSITGRPSSCNWMNLAPDDDSGRPRMVMFEMPSPVGASASTPGMSRSSSPTDRGDSLAISASRSTLVEVALSSRSRPFATPVVTTSGPCGACTIAGAADAATIAASGEA